MKFLGRITQWLSLKRSPIFDSISGYEDVKSILHRALSSDDSINILFWGEPASSKTMFLMELAKEKGTRRVQVQE